MKFLYSMSGTVRENSAFSSTRALTELARTAEEAGFDGLSFDDHPAPPRRRRADPGRHDCFGPFVALAAVAAGTTSLRLFTSLAVLPYRNPLLLAKITSTLDIVSGGRVELGLGTGYLPDEAAALGVDFSCSALRQLEQEGATWTAFGGGGGDLGERTAAIARFHDEVIARIVP